MRQSKQLESYSQHKLRSLTRALAGKTDNIEEGASLREMNEKVVKGLVHAREVLRHDKELIGVIEGLETLWDSHVKQLIVLAAKLAGMTDRSEEEIVAYLTSYSRRLHKLENPATYAVSYQGNA